MTALRKVAALTATAIFVQILLGALTRLTDSGLSCPDWPLCYGLWFPSPAELTALEVDYTFGQVMLEWTHRFNAAVLVGPLTLALLVMAWRKRCEVPTIFKVMVVAAVLLLIQAGLGGFTVLDRNSPWSVAVHGSFLKFPAPPNALGLGLRPFVFKKKWLRKQNEYDENLFHTKLLYHIYTKLKVQSYALFMSEMNIDTEIRV